MANTRKATVSFRCDIETDLPHPDEMTVTSFLGRAELTFEDDGEPDYETFTAVTITDLWMGIDIATRYDAWEVRRVSVPSEKWTGKRFKALKSELEQAAIDQYRNPGLPVTLPDEIRPISPVLLERFRPGPVFVVEAFVG